MKRHKPFMRYWLSATLMSVAGSIFTGCIPTLPGGGGIGGLSVGAIAPEITAAGWINGDAPSAADMEGKVVVVDAWAHW